MTRVYVSRDWKMFVRNDPYIGAYVTSFVGGWHIVPVEFWGDWEWIG